MKSLPLSGLVVAAAFAVVLATRVEAEGLEVEPVIGGKAMRCYDFRGRAVRTLQTTELGDVGRASIIARMPIISLDTGRMAGLPPPMQIFFYAHECAHHVLGHNFHPTSTSEPEADCWSIKYGRDRGFFTRNDVEAFAPFLRRSRPSPFGHLPGPERHANLLKCFDDRTTERASTE